MAIEVPKLVIGFVVSTSVGAVVGNAIKATTPANINLANRILVGIGGVIISSMISDKATDYVIDIYDSITKKKDKNEP